MLLKVNKFILTVYFIVVIQKNNSFFSIAYTWWSYMRDARAKNVGWRIDYFVLSNKLKKYLVDSVIREKVTGSDHCPVVAYINFDLD
jgi:exonuclease III